MVARSVRAGLHPQSGRGEPGVLKERCSQAVDTAVPQWGRALRAPAPPPPLLSPCVARQHHVAVRWGGRAGLGSRAHPSTAPWTLESLTAWSEAFAVNREPRGCHPVVWI